MNIKKIGFGGGCHWCTEAYFQSLSGVVSVEQGWISSVAPDDYFSEAVLVHFHPEIIPIQILISIHLHTHASTSNHQFREKYRSAVYFFDGNADTNQRLIAEHQDDFNEAIITRALKFDQFKLNAKEQLNYFKRNKEGSFCKRYIHPKLQIIEKKYSFYVANF